ncbi:SGNH hydrolase-type esterase domain-containing protein [Artemisia annua]|uniref:SGNH hydrolase-type esterase domain-containing protein n=1 Tax=Artemisia annua TaxID=35608 RepID=A0A2U1NCD6_ARTAN|nr:SGNH hydrolase-type esterase domain-containing protein [Artemisia annua]
MSILWLFLGSFLVMRVSGAEPKANQPRPFFVFGDSLVDNGNNNFLYTSARADAPPYGIDTPSHRPSGRFSNGLNIPDIISEHLGSEPILPYLTPALTDKNLHLGANFASAGIGILNDTGFQFVSYPCSFLVMRVSGAEPKANQPRPFFVFGDSLVDNGNNNFLYTSARADAPPYGIDTPSHRPSGRFSNGLNIPDIIS